jgi:tetratricopeptide (TPR) repeat protein
MNIKTKINLITIKFIKTTNCPIFNYLMEINYYKLGCHNQYVENNYVEMKRNYLMAIKSNCLKSMNNLGLYYKYIENNYVKMKQYYLMAIKLNSTKAMNNLGYYYITIEKNYTEMKRYYLMAIDLNDSIAMHNLGCYYKKHGNNEEMERYFLMAMPKCSKQMFNKYKKILGVKSEYVKSIIISTRFNIIENVDEDFECPITLENPPKAYKIKNCNHQFSEAILQCNMCPLCRCEI